MALAAACASRPPIGPQAPETSGASVAFVPQPADPVRKAKLAALASRLDAHYAAELSANRATGGVAGIVLGGELVYARGLGIVDTETQAPVDADTVFRIASVTKNVTASAIMKLRDEGKVLLDAPVTTYVPELVVRPLPRDTAPMTVRHLLTMSSGLPYDDQWGAVTFGKSHAELGEMLSSGIVLASAPGERYLYSNLGYALLGRIVERASGEGFRRYVLRHLLEPLGMRSSVWESSDVPKGRMAVGYYREGERLVAEPRESDGTFAAAGGLYTSLNDLARYVAFQLSAYPPRDAPESGPLRRSTLREMHAGERWMRWGPDVPVTSRRPDGRVALSAGTYGMGWVNHSTCFYEGIVQHGGFEPGYYAYVRLLPKSDIGIITLSTTGPLGRLESFETVFGILRDGGMLDIAPIALAPELAEASSVVSRLLEASDPDLIERTFDPQSLRYSWVRQQLRELARAWQEHGACRTFAVRAASRTEVTLEFSCDRGALTAKIWLTPVTPHRIQAVELRATPAHESASPPSPGPAICKD
ncbi:MAG TPA: serine hydrolase domain-containing protein [Polyangiaceae bacterium]|nr:serine hydrolase domain-containing protein [Polyangiaceae bacterium]HKY37320.1 serine hydrolase domain-containing protein [Polyangiaceae bacterium]